MQFVLGRQTSIVLTCVCMRCYLSAIALSTGKHFLIDQALVQKSKTSKTILFRVAFLAFEKWNNCWPLRRLIILRLTRLGVFVMDLPLLTVNLATGELVKQVNGSGDVNGNIVGVDITMTKPVQRSLRHLL